MSERICESHPNAQLINDWQAGDVICPECGLVVEERVIDVSFEWRTFCENNNRFRDSSRVGPMQYQIAKQLDETLKDIADKLNLNKSIFYVAQYYCNEIISERLIRVPNNILIAASAIYIACNKENAYRSLKEIESACNAQISSNINKVYYAFMNLNREKGYSHIPSVSCGHMLKRYCSLLNLSTNIKKLAIKFSSKGDKIAELSSKRPSSIAAASIYLACEIENSFITIQRISEISGVSMSTIKNIIRILE